MAKRKSSDPQKGLARAVKVLRERENLDQAALAERAGLSVSWIARIESGDHNPTWGSMRLLARGLGVSMETLAEVAEDFEGA